MASLFISHSTHDRIEVTQLCEWLTGQGYAWFLDFDPRVGIPAGAKWEPELYGRLRRADAVLFVASPASLESPWCFAELVIARSLGKTIIPVLLAGDSGHPLLGDTQTVDLSGGDERGFERLDRALRLADLDLERMFAWDPERSPFPGLGSFEERDAGVFFGRRAELEQLLESLRSSRRRYAGRLLAVVGPSGSGKSSLVRAGLIPRLRRARVPWVVVPVLRPGGRPMRQLALALAAAFGETAGPRSVEEIERSLGAGADGLVKLAEELAHLASRDSSPAVLVFIDQAEELVTLAGPEERERFLALLRGASRGDGPVWALLTLRSEFLSAFLRSEGGAGLFDAQQLLGPLMRSRLAEVIERPAARAGLDLEPGLVALMVEDTAGGDALPLLAYTLSELFERTRRRPGAMVSLQDYEDLGGVVGALRRSADRERQRLHDRGLGDRVLPALRSLVAIGPEGQPTRRRLPRAALGERDNEVLEGFIEARLLSSGEFDGEPVVEVAHEALLRQWSPLSEAIEANHHELRLRSELERAAQDWARNDRRRDYLLTGERLHDARRLTDSLQAGMAELTGVARDLVTASLQRDEHERAARQRRVRRAFAGLLGALAIVSVAALVSYWQYGVAREQRDRADSRRLASQALDVIASKPDLGMLLSLEAWRKNPTIEARSAAIFAAQVSAGNVGLLRNPDDGAVKAVAYSPDGKLLAEGGQNQTIRIWDLRSRRPRGEPLTLPERFGSDSSTVLALKFSPDGRSLAAAYERGADDQVVLWRLMEHGRPQPHELPDSNLLNTAALAFGPGGQVLAAAGSQRTITVWRVDKLRRLATLRVRGPDTLPSAIAFDGRTLVAISFDGVLMRWNVDRQRSHAVRLPGKSNYAAIAADGRRVATYEYAHGRLMLWDSRSGSRLTRRVLGGDDAPVLVLGPSSLLVASQDRFSLFAVPSLRPHPIPPSAEFSNAEFSPDAFSALAVVPAALSGVAFSPDARALAIGGTGGVRVAALTNDGLLRRTLVRGRDGTADYLAQPMIAFSTSDPARLTARTGLRLTTWQLRRAPAVSIALPITGVNVGSSGNGGTIAYAEPVPGTVSVLTSSNIHTFFAGAYGVLALSDDGRVIATKGRDGIRLWNADSGTPWEAGGHFMRVDANALAFDRRGDWLAGANSDGTISLWPVAAGPSGAMLLGTPRTLNGHSGSATAVAFSADGTRLATAGDDRLVRVWDVTSGTMSGPPLAAGAGVDDLAWTPDGRTIGAAGRDGKLRLWDVGSRQLLGNALQSAERVQALSFNANGTRLATADFGGAVTLWNSILWSDDRNRLQAALCVGASRNLTKGEWQQFLPGERYRRTCR